MHFTLKYHSQHKSPRLFLFFFLWHLKIQSHTDPFSFSCILNIGVSSGMLEREGVNLPKFMAPSRDRWGCWTSRMWHVEKATRAVHMPLQFLALKSASVALPCSHQHGALSNLETVLDHSKAQLGSQQPSPVTPQAVHPGHVQSWYGELQTHCEFGGWGGRIWPALQLLNSRSIKISLRTIFF